MCKGQQQEENWLDLMGSCAMTHPHFIEEHIQTRVGNMFVYIYSTYERYTLL